MKLAGLVGSVVMVAALAAPALADDACPTEGYGGGKSWYINNEPITAFGGRYIKYGLPRVLGATEVTKTTDVDGAAIYTEANAATPTEVVYLLKGAGCEFQPYQIQGFVLTAQKKAKSFAGWSPVLYAGAAGEVIEIEVKAKFSPRLAVWLPGQTAATEVIVKPKARVAKHKVTFTEAGEVKVMVDGGPNLKEPFTIKINVKKKGAKPA